MPRTDRPPLRHALSTPESKHAYVRRLFSVIADRYDLITVLLSYGQDRRWKQRLVSMAIQGIQEVQGVQEVQEVQGVLGLDLACGTGDIAYALASRGARVVGLDITARMVTLARSKCRIDRHASFLVGDMMALPFGDSRFDVITTGYGIRNVPAIAGALSEIRRVLRPGGTFLSLDFNRPANAAVRVVYLAYLTIVGSALGMALHRDADTYRYIPESIRRYPGAAAIADQIRAEGFAECEWHPVLGGLMALHRARK